MTSVLRRVVSGIELGLATPFWLPVLCSKAVSGSVNTRMFQSGSQAVALFPGDIGNLIRRGYYRMTLLSCSARCVISFGTIFSSPRVRIGQNVYIGAYCSIADCSIGDDCMLGSFVSIINGRATHNFDRVDVPIRLQGGKSTPVSLDRDCWVGNGAIVMVDMPVGAVVGAGSVVTKAPARFSISVGNPAREVGSRGVKVG